MTRRIMHPELRRRRCRARWIGWSVVVAVTVATSAAAILVDGNWEWASPGNRPWLVLGVLLIVGMTVTLTTWNTRRYIRAPRHAVRNRNGSGGPLGVVVAEGFLSRLAFGMISFSLPLYAHRLGMSIENIGVLLATNTAVAILLKPMMGAVIDRIGVRTAYIVAVGLRTVVVFSLVFAQTPLHLFLVRGLHGVAISLRDPSSSTILAALGGKKAVAQRFSWYQTVKTVAGSAGGFSAGILLTALAGDHAFVFAVSAILSGLPMLLVLIGLRGPQVTGLPETGEENAGSCGTAPAHPALRAPGGGHERYGLSHGESASTALRVVHGVVGSSRIIAVRLLHRHVLQRAVVGMAGGPGELEAGAGGQGHRQCVLLPGLAALPELCGPCHRKGGG